MKKLQEDILGRSELETKRKEEEEEEKEKDSLGDSFELLNETIEREDRIQNCMQKAEEFSKHGEFQKAVDMYDLVVILDRDNDKARIGKVKALINGGELDEVTGSDNRLGWKYAQKEVI